MISPKRDALLAVWHVKSIPSKSLQQQVRDFFELKDIKLHWNTFKTKSGNKILTLQAKTNTPFGKNKNLLGIVEINTKRFVFVGAAGNDVSLNKYLTTFNRTMKTFRELKSREQQYAKPLRIKVVDNRSLFNITVLVKDSPIADHKEEQLRLLNGVYPKGDLNTLHEIKIIQ
jgi:predicted Zn-dependent protease